MSEQKIEMICGQYYSKSNISHHRKKCVACKTIKYLNAQILEKNNELEDKNKIIDFLKSLKISKIKF